MAQLVLVHMYLVECMLLVVFVSLVDYMSAQLLILFWDATDWTTLNVHLSCQHCTLKWFSFQAGCTFSFLTLDWWNEFWIDTCDLTIEWFLCCSQNHIISLEKLIEGLNWSFMVVWGQLLDLCGRTGHFEAKAGHFVISLKSCVGF